MSMTKKPAARRVAYTPLTKRRLRAMAEALTERLAGEIETDIPLSDYRAARMWVEEQLAKREKPGKKTA